jgi:polysaccharide biosynthesis transport protein
MESFKQESQAGSALHFLDYWRIIRIRKTVILAVFLLVVLTATLVTFVLPEFFASTVTVEVKKDSSTLDPIGRSSAVQGFDPYFLQTEFEKIQSKAVLYQVISNLNLGDVYRTTRKYEMNLKPEETFLLLRNDMRVSQTRNTELIEITVYNEDKAMAAKIANEIAAVYLSWRMEDSEARFSQGFGAISNQLASAENEFEKSQQEVNRLLDDLQITDMDESSTRNAMQMENQSLLQYQAQYDSLNIEQSRTLKQLSQISEINDKAELKVVVPTVFQEDSLTLNFPALFQREADASTRLAALQAEFGPEHGSVKAARAELDKITETLDVKISGLIHGVQIKAMANSNRLATLKEEIEKKGAEYREKWTKIVPYIAAKEELNRRRNVRDSIAMKIAQEKINVSLMNPLIVKVINPAEEALRPARPNKTLNIALGVIVGLVVGVGLAFFIEYLDTSVKTIDDVERALQTHVLGVIPQNVGSLLDEGADSPHAEAYRVLRTNILFSRKADTQNTITVVSGGAGEGKSTTLFNLACIFAQNGSRVLIVDSDLRRPSIHKILRISNTLGLTNYLLGQKPLEEVIQKTALASLDFLPSGKLPSSSMGILSSVRMKELVKELKKRYDFVFFDSPPIMGVSDASVLASEVDVTLQVIQYRRYPQPMTIRAKQMIEKVGGNLLGVVLNNINMAQDENYYYYSGYYYDYYSKHTDDDDESPQKNGQKNGDAGKPAESASRLDLKKY